MPAIRWNEQHSRALCAKPQRADAPGQPVLLPAGVASAKSSGGKVVLRIEDLDAVRCPREFADLLEADLAWLGLAADEGGSKGGPRGPYYQSERSAIYEEYYQKLVRKGLVYPCFCSRSQLHAADAPHRSDGKVVYAGTCRNLTPEEIVLRTARRKPAWRVMVPDETISFVDGHMGPLCRESGAGLRGFLPAAGGRCVCLPAGRGGG